jgi:hypothetical protein
MYEIEVTVTTYTRDELRLTADWPLIGLQAPGSIEILGKLLPGEIVPRLSGSVRRSEFPVNQSLRLDLQLGDRLMARCFLNGKSSRIDPGYSSICRCLFALRKTGRPRLAKRHSDARIRLWRVCQCNWRHAVFQCDRLTVLCVRQQQILFAEFTF